MLRSLTAFTDSQSRTIHPETLNQWTHAAAFALSLLGAAIMLPVVAPSGEPLRIAGCVIYLVLQAALYAASTLSHSFEEGPRRDFFRMLDQICIFLMIVGSFTPFALVYLWQDGWWLLLAAMWALAIVGIVGRIRGGTRTTSLPIFILIGWLPVLAFPRMYEAISAPGLALIFAGGLSYTGGIWFLMNDFRKPWFHAAWHLSTILGSGIHYVFLLEYVAKTPIS